ncbi:hypothetical protein CP532_2653 [Ophiocordyceps camponoti-leonardi (nom. inval.)]|nr:hypothetical protein CP532_2653 [Ophiocordyceps camponoti-leonardi (nom. inval.)]
MTPTNTNEKASRRRQQVKSAQVRHRQRKAEYTKQLELDAVRLRQLVSAVEDEVHGLKKRNEEMRRCLCEAEKAKMAAGDAATQVVAWLDAPMGSEVSLGFHDAVDSPCLQIEGSGGDWSLMEGTPMPPEVVELRAVNFILALEHVCWDHFDPRDFNDPQPIDPTHGHTLMASAYLMATAPSSVYDSCSALATAVAPDPTWRRLLHLPDTAVQRRKEAPVMRWPAPTISLDSLRGLAQSLNAGDVELTPVQIWFELAARYRAERLLRPDSIEALLRRFCGVVHCVAYGAAVERLVFESVVMGVLGPPEKWDL